MGEMKYWSFYRIAYLYRGHTRNNKYSTIYTKLDPKKESTWLVAKLPRTRVLNSLLIILPN